MDYTDRINAAYGRDPELRQRGLAEATGISQPTINRILRGERAPKLNELIALADALGSTLSELTGDSPVAARLVSSARATVDGATAAMHAELTHYFELDAFLRDHGYLPA